ncbi:MAG: efflux RND transporter periplasmic adaptor subunit [Thiobacillus sp.]|nr:efflux RND transporter periplasmic adaptor subunit [Thiobacillus sp.]
MVGTRRLIGWFILALALAGAGYWLWSRPAGNGKVKKDKPPVPVLVARAEAHDMPVTLELVGRAEAYESVTLMARVDGQVVAVDFAEGQHVRGGQVLVRLEDGDFVARQRQAEANLARDQANLGKARADVTRYAALKDQGFVSSEKVDEVRALLAAAEATVRADQAAVDLARLQWGYTVIRAPFDGVVGARLVHPGTAVKVNDTQLAVVNRVQPLHVGFAVPEKYLGPLRNRLGQGALKVTVGVPGEAGPVVEGSVRFLDNAVDAATGTIRMKAVLANQDERLTPGQFLDVNLVLETLRDVVTVPAEAVQQGPEGSFVYVVQPDQTARQQPVKLALTRDGRAALREGLAAGDTVVTDGHSRLTPRSKVKIKEPNGAVPGPK